MLPQIGSVRHVHHLNCGTFTPVGIPECVTHILAVEFDHGLVLVDVGLGRQDVAHPIRGLGQALRAVRPRLRSADTAVQQLAGLGFAAGDVAGIVATHLDYDHISGALDFPAAPVHLTVTELFAAASRPGIRGRIRYRPHHLTSITSRAHTYAPAEAVPVMNFHGHPLTEAGDLVLIPLPGHTAGHAAVAIRDPHRRDRWLIHAGDAFLHHTALTSTADPSMDRVERMLAMDPSTLTRNHAALRIAADQGHLVICSHDRGQYEHLAASEHLR
ncbi:MBL fold metallo-hydrolase (plasmid) [Gordonia rubripertincta]|uniref:MBL fold metallo-hydrolase n=1 Tax=Gordonia rubripertincta TaxID=36822 RepID=A0AAW6RHA7_GORRU|nr:MULTISPECIES: MBL fold metallo-hydrolase [Gordonia]MDG6783096.1 MBL fold metallo-hydrolase [Gordonia rubripertincta]NKY65403.1 MBL fold metallo-hydrolase [Gordonia rubripertincta]